MRYFAISNGLRGCYMPDSVYIGRFATRRELKSALEYEAESLRDAGYIGLSKRAIASLAAAAWRESGKPAPTVYDFVAPYRQSYQDSYSYGLFCSVSSRRDYREQEESNHD